MAFLRLMAQLLQTEQVQAAPRETSEGCLTCFVLDWTSTRLPSGAGQGRGPQVPTEVWSWVLLPPPNIPRASPSRASPFFRHGSTWAQHPALFGNTKPEAFNNIRDGVSCPAEGTQGQTDAGYTLGQEAALHTSPKPRY